MNTVSMTMQVQNQMAQQMANLAASQPEAADSKSFQKTMQEASGRLDTATQQVQKTQAQASEDNKPQAVSKTEAKEPQAGLEAEDVEKAAAAEVVDWISAGMPKAEDPRASFLFALFGTDVGEVDEDASDMEILKNLYKKLNDPEEKFAVMMMMAFLQANPQLSLEDIQQQIDPSMLSNPDVSPVTKVLGAIQRLMNNDEDVKSTPLLDSLMTEAVSDEPDFRALVKKFDVQVEKAIFEMVPQDAKPAGETVKSGLNAHAQFQSAVRQARGMMRQASNTSREDSGSAAKQGKQESGKTALNIDELQSKVDAGSFLMNTRAADFMTNVKGLQVPVSAPQLVQQIQTGITANLAEGKTEFTMKLTPEGLGELTVKLVEDAGKTVLHITASSVQTQKLLTSEIDNLRTVMRPYQVEVEPVTVQSKAEAGRQFSGQLGQQAFGEHQHGAYDGSHSNQASVWQQYAEDSQDDDAQAAWFDPVLMSNGLNAYI